MIMSKKKTTDCQYRRGMTFTQNKKPTKTMSKKKTQIIHLPSLKKHKKCSLGSKFDNKPQIAVSGTKSGSHRQKQLYTQQINFKPITLPECSYPTKRINTTTATTAIKPSCSKTGELTTCKYWRKEPPRPLKTESSADWLKRKEQPRKEKNNLTVPTNWQENQWTWI